MRPTEKQIKKLKGHYRAICEDPKADCIERRIAWAMESALRWATESTDDWPMEDEPKLTALVILEDLMKEAKGGSASLP